MTATINFTDLAERYITVWNTTGPADRRALVEKLYAPGARYVDPLVDVTGHDALDAAVGAVQAQFAGLEFRLAGAVDGHHDVARFTWELGPAGGEALVVGFDVVTVGPDGRITHVAGFLDRVPDLG